jgi:Multiubiquitin
MAEDEKTVTIVVEGSPHEWPKSGMISFEQVVTWIFPDYSPNDQRTYTVKYKKGDNEKPEGQLVKGASVKVKDRMTFSVSRTGQS